MYGTYPWNKSRRKLDRQNKAEISDGLPETRVDYCLNLIEKQLPLPSSLLISNDALCLLTTCFTIAKPRPFLEPCSVLVRESSTR